MPSPSVVIGRITQIGPPGDPQTFIAGPGARYAPVQIQGGAICHLDLNDARAPAWGDVLREFAQSHEPVYLETDPNTGVIQQVLIPDEQYVTRLTPLPGGDSDEVEFSNSHARHLLHRHGPGDPAYASHLTALRDALRHGTPVLVSETLDTLEILDVRPPRAPFVPPPAPAPIPGLAAGAPPTFNSYPCPSLAPISAAQAATLFGLVSA